MTFKKPNVSATVLVSYALFALSGAILVFSLVATMNVDVLSNWKITVPTAPIHARDTVTITSTYTKERKVSGKAVRYIECQNRNKVYVRYPLNEAVANRAVGTGGTGIVVKIPNTIPDLPALCKFTIAIEYPVYPWRKVTETASSNSFTLLPGDDTPEVISSLSSTPVAIQKNQFQASGSNSTEISKASVSSSLPQSTPISQQPQQDNPVVTNSTPTSVERNLDPTPEQPQPGVVRRIINTVTGLL